MSRFTTEPALPGKPGTQATDPTPLDVTVGIDFGTSAAKLAFREFGGRQSILVPSPGRLMPWPCVVQVRDGHLHFADPQEGAFLTIRRLKMLLAEECGAERDGYRDQMRARLAETGCSVRCMAALLLAYFMRHATDRAKEYFARQGRPIIHLTYNVGAPLETFADDSSGTGNGAISDGFLQVAFWAERLAAMIPDSTGGWPLADAKRAFEHIADQHPHVPSVRTVFVVPETHAVVTGAVLARGRLESGHYVVVDIGAGTTDVAVFLYNSLARKEGRWAVTYLADAVKHEASTQADRCIADLICERLQEGGKLPPLDAEVLDMARRAKERSGGSETIVVDGGIPITGVDFRERVTELTDRLFRHYRKNVLRAMREKTTNGLQQSFHLLLLGGGSRFVPFRERFLHDRPDPNHPKLEPVEMWVSLRDHLRVLTDAGPEDVPQRDYEIYSLVHGLTTHVVRLPGFWRPDDVEDMPLPPESDRSLYLRMDDD